MALPQPVPGSRVAPVTVRPPGRGGAAPDSHRLAVHHGTGKSTRSGPGRPIRGPLRPGQAPGGPERASAAATRARVYSWAGLAITCSTVPSSTISPARMTAIRSQA